MSTLKEVRWALGQIWFVISSLLFLPLPPIHVDCLLVWTAVSVVDTLVLYQRSAQRKGN